MCKETTLTKLLAIGSGSVHLIAAHLRTAESAITVLCGRAKKIVGCPPEKKASEGFGSFSTGPPSGMFGQSLWLTNVKHLSSPHTFIWACSRYECVIEQKKRADQEAADRLLQARKDARRRHDELMRKPWRKPSTPTKEILRRGDGARRRRALRRSIENAAGQVEKTLPAMCRWNRATAGEDRGIREFIHEQRAARKHAISLAPQQEAVAPPVPWNDVKATAQQRLQDLVRGRRCDANGGGAHNVHGQCASKYSSSEATAAQDAAWQPDVQQSCEGLDPTFWTRSSQLIIPASSQTADKYLLNDDLSHTCTGVSTAQRLSSRSSADGSAQQAAPHKQAASSNVVTCCLPMTFGELLRQSMSVVNMRSRQSVDSGAQYIGSTNSQLVMSTAAPATEESSKKQSARAVHNDNLVESTRHGSDSVDSPDICRQNCETDTCSSHLRQTGVRFSAEQVVKSSEQGVGLDADAADAAKFGDADRPGAKENSSELHNCHNAVTLQCEKNQSPPDAQGVVNVRSGTTKVTVPLRSDPVPSDTQTPAARGAQVTDCYVPRTASSAACTVKESPSHSIRMQTLIEKMETLQQLHKHVQQELQITKKTESGASQATHSCIQHCQSKVEKPMATHLSTPHTEDAEPIPGAGIHDCVASNGACRVPRASVCTQLDASMCTQ